MFVAADIVLASAEDLRLHGEGGPELLRHAIDIGLVLKLDHPASHVLRSGVDVLVRAASVRRAVDTAAAGDGFVAAMLPPAWPAPCSKPLHAPATTWLASSWDAGAPSSHPAP